MLPERTSPTPALEPYELWAGRIIETLRERNARLLAEVDRLRRELAGGAR